MKKPRIRYQLKANSKKNERVKEELIVAEINAGFIKHIDDCVKYERCKISLQASIKPKYFGKMEDKFKFDDQVFQKFSKNNSGIKIKMQLFEKIIDEMYSNYLLNDILPTAERFKNDLNIKLGRKKREVVKERTILTYITDKIIEFEKLKDSGRKDEISENSIKVYRTLKNYISLYEKIKKAKLTFQNFDEKKYWEFWDINDDILKGKIKIPDGVIGRKRTLTIYGFLKTSIMKYQKSLIYILKLAKKEGIKVALDISNANLVIDGKTTQKDIYVDLDDLHKILNFEPVSENLKLAKDYCILASFTGMRFESMQIAHLETIQKHKDFFYIHSKQNKTDTECYIPLIIPVHDVLKKYNNRFPKFPANQILNKDLKDLFRLSGINTIIDITHDTYKSKTIIEKKKIHQIISTHDFRKSFVTNLHNNNVEETIITDITHPNKKPKHAMTAVYNKSTLMDKAIKFYNEVNRANKISQNKFYRF
jgi:hypothetical protein